MYLKFSLWLIFLCSISLLVSSAEETTESDDRNLRPLCLVCKCTPHKTYESQFVVHCSDPSVAFELSRDDSWPTSVRTLSLTHASLQNIPKLPIHNLHTLSLSHNALVTIPDNAFQNISLKELNLGYNGLSELNHESLKGNSELKILHLQHNNFAKLDWDVMNKLDQLNELYLQDNYLKQLEGKSNLEHLKMLNISGNELEELPIETCSGLPSLESLFVADNQLSVIPSCLLQLSALKELILDGNKIVEVEDGAFYKLSSLQYLSLSRLGELKQVNGAALRGLGSLQRLRVSHNPQLTSVHRTLLVQGQEGDAQHDWKFIDVDLSYNALTSLPSDLAPWDMLGSLNLQGNPWDCSCSAQWMLDKLLPALYNKNSSLLVEVRCAQPLRFADKRFVHWLNHENQAWCEEDGRPAPQTQLTVVQSGSSHGMLIALAVMAGVALLLLGLGFVLQRRANAQRKELATQIGRCRNPRNGNVRLTHPKLGI